MFAEDRPDPDEYTPEPDPVTATEEYTPEVSVDDPTREANPADVAEQLLVVPTDYEVDPQLADDED
ncbi:hypothetical protein G6019_04470 [Dietzia sp. DQ12-76]|nr:hypothetical protein [Dietzia sp. DQ11-38-2]MBB1023689.1 hypothetical protein [Dietzia sp. DQ12-76]MBB1027249.1 hypothetical protein [Dietzia sp. DQ11-38-2]